MINRKSNKTPIVFVHGFAVNWTCFKKEIKFFKKEKYPVIYSDLRGHGRSKKGTKIKQITFKRFSKDIEEILKKLAVEKIILVGHSLGGMIAMKYAETNSAKIERLIILNSTDKYPKRFKFMKILHQNETIKEAYSYFTGKYFKEKETPLDVTDEESKMNPKLFIAKSMRYNNPKVLSAIINLIFFKNDLKIRKISCPTLILGGNEDELFSPKEVEKFSKKIKHQITKILIGKHDIIIRNSEIVSQEIKQFIHTDKEFFKK